MSGMRSSVVINHLCAIVAGMPEWEIKTPVKQFIVLANTARGVEICFSKVDVIHCLSETAHKGNGSWLIANAPQRKLFTM